MRLTRFSVANYRRIPDFEVAVRNHVVLIGPNDSGKSSILNALHLLLGCSLSQILAMTTVRDFTERDHSIVVEAEFREFTDDERAGFPDAISVGPPERLLLRLEIEVDPADPELILTRRSMPEAGTAPVPNREQLALFGWQYVPADRSLDRELGGGRAGVVRRLLRSLDLTADLGAIVTALQQFRTALDDADALSQFRTELAEALNAAMPAAVTRDDIRLITSGEVDDDPLGGVSLGVDQNGQVAPLQEQSDGRKSLMLMAALGLAHRGANVVAVDEPERHLHPLASRSIARLLSGGSGQRIIATHASAIASAMPSLDLVALSPDRAPRQLPTGAPASATAFVLRWWNPLLIEPLTARKIICVEGPADLQMVRGCARALGFNLDKMAISVFDLGGADNFRTAYELFGPPGFGVQLLGLVDLDHSAEWAAVLGVGPADLVQHGVYVATPDLEAAYTAALGPVRTLDLLTGSQLFHEAKLLQAAGAATRAALTGGALATVLRRFKVKAGGAVGAGLNRDDALLIQPIADLLATAQ